MQPLLSIKNLSIDFHTESSITNALKNISIEINSGEVVALVGESGSGKSITALSILQLLPSPPAKYTSGEIIFTEENNSIDLLKRSRHEMQNIRGNKIAMIFQEPMTSLNPVLTCGSQIQEALIQHKKINKREAKKQTLEWFDKVKLPTPSNMYDRYPHQLSGGQKQRVMIAMAMCCEPSLLICDEPTTALDVTVQKTILQLLKELQQQSNMGIIFITHDLGVVAEIADRAVVMYKGEIVEQNSVKEIFFNPQHAYTKALLACRPVNHERGKRLPIVSDFMEVSTTEKKQETPTEKKGSSTDNVLKIENLSVWFPTKKSIFGKTLTYTKAVDDVSFDLYKGETLGLVGESGCGKTTLGRTLLRLIEPTSGKIIYNGVDLTAKKRDEIRALRKEMQIIFQDPYSSLNPRITIGSAIAEPLKVHGINSTEKQRRDKVADLLEKVDLKAEHFNRYPHEFSGGQRQRIVIARALALNPSFIICDESVSALDVSVQAQVLNLLNDLKKEFGFTIIFISHDLSVVRYISDRIMVMNKGKIEETGAADSVYFNPQSDYTKRLIASIPKGVIANHQSS
ncbi:MAG: ABC transporter ATP-binding protein [Chitinophagaceae bacterium]|nr:ABC transporter ATP-binding protein [Chitinophagaceae bacterium]MBK8312308.1 ABC transporter ATP-binding protein [Chitinophagaceae bacterium]MBP6477367.1 ABC transporter ATP-binding protein [Chitinophagaceae bacterium]MBP7108434.1 ABC transporter ATP-binding protein [Chitinophagaceae bacterium]MBP7313869.1 ABC transporter ATP-binding protein [Chitinophagaceae bacterium]